MNQKQCHYLEHELGWGGNCYCCSKCGAVFIEKDTEINKLQNKVCTLYYSEPYNKQFQDGFELARYKVLKLIDRI